MTNNDFGIHSTHSKIQSVVGRPLVLRAGMISFPYQKCPAELVQSSHYACSALGYRRETIHVSVT